MTKVFVPKLIPKVDGLALNEIHYSLAVALQANRDLEERCVVVQLGSEARQTSRDQHVQ